MMKPIELGVTPRTRLPNSNMASAPRKTHFGEKIL